MDNARYHKSFRGHWPAPSSGTKSQIIAAFAELGKSAITVQRGSANLTFDLEQCAQRAPVGPSLDELRTAYKPVFDANPEVFRRKATDELLAKCSATDTVEFKREVKHAAVWTPPNDSRFNASEQEWRHEKGQVADTHHNDRSVDECRNEILKAASNSLPSMCVKWVKNCDVDILKLMKLFMPSFDGSIPEFAIAYRARDAIVISLGDMTDDDFTEKLCDLGLGDSTAVSSNGLSSSVSSTSSSASNSVRSDGSTLERRLVESGAIGPDSSIDEKHSNSSNPVLAQAINAANDGDSNAASLSSAAAIAAMARARSIDSAPVTPLKPVQSSPAVKRPESSAVKPIRPPLTPINTPNKLASSGVKRAAPFTPYPEPSGSLMDSIAKVTQKPNGWKPEFDVERAVMLANHILTPPKQVEDTRPPPPPQPMAIPPPQPITVPTKVWLPR